MNKNSTEEGKIGLLGGTFNPIHSGHIRAAEVIQKLFALDKVLFIPSFIPPHKESEQIVSPDHRFKMVELAVENNSYFSASPLEIEEKGTSYSILTLQKVRKIYPKACFFFILGIDAFLEIDTWKSHERVLDQCKFVVISRRGYNLADAKNVLNKKYASGMCELSVTKKGRENIDLSCEIFLVSFDALAVASTDVRNRLRKNLPITQLVPKPVADYIFKNNLYQ
ncbi:nicotinate-nucleotide adenylyltransferase [Acidobacteriota bacterium]